jgi:O-acetyl-ADP-ribose deacetylase
VKKISLHFVDVFETEQHTISVDKNTQVRDLGRILLRELELVSSVSQSIGNLFKDISRLPIIYNPKLGVFSSNSTLNICEFVKNEIMLTYYFPPPSGVTLDNIFFDEKTKLSDKSILVTVEWLDESFPIILPLNIEEAGDFLTRIMFLQIKVIKGEQVLPDAWKADCWQLFNTRTEERINQQFGETLTGQICHGDFLRLSLKTDGERDEIIILDQEPMRQNGALEIKLGDDLLDSIQIEHVEPYKIDNCSLEVLQGNIVTQKVDVIVNASKVTLNGSTREDGSIHQVAGPELIRASRLLAPCPPGRAVLTPGFFLPANWVIHTVGPIYKDGTEDEEELLAEAYRSSLKIALYSNFSSIAFPAISTEMRDSPIKGAAKISWETIKHFLRENKDCPLRLVRIIVYNDEICQTYQGALQDLFTV